MCELLSVIIMCFIGLKKYITQSIGFGINHSCPKNHLYRVQSKNDWKAIHNV